MFYCSGKEKSWGRSRNFYCQIICPSHFFYLVFSSSSHRRNVGNRQISKDSLTEVLQKCWLRNLTQVPQPLSGSLTTPTPPAPHTARAWVLRPCQTRRFPPCLPPIQLDHRLHTPVHTNKFLLSAASESGVSESPTSTGIDPVNQSCRTLSVSEKLQW